MPGRSWYSPRLRAAPAPMTDATASRIWTPEMNPASLNFQSASLYTRNRVCRPVDDAGTPERVPRGACAPVSRLAALFAG